MKNGIICEYYHDKGSFDELSAVYKPTVELLNRQISLWSETGITFAGIIHSHLAHEVHLSTEDLNYIERIFSSLPQNHIRLYFPIVLPEKNRIISYLAERSNNKIVIKGDIVTIIF